MLDNYSLQELIILGVVSPFLLCSIIAIFNFDWLNNTVLKFYGWIDKKYQATDSWFWKPFYGILKFPSLIASPIGHTGWKSGLSFGLGTFSLVALVGILYLVAWIAAIIVGIIIALYILAAIFGGK